MTMGFKTVNRPRHEKHKDVHPMGLIIITAFSMLTWFSILLLALRWFS